ncbi:MAG: ATP-dependent zinc metalloprotease FtsH [Chloroflexi bacterium]|nr:ATP-dependent zinc metalloprotease FtsH [Chloroflexota bacterium]
MQPEPTQKNNIFRTLIVITVLLAVFYFLYQYAGKMNVEKINYTKFREKVDSGEVKSVTFNGREISGEYAKPKVGKFKTVMPFEDKDLPEYLAGHNVDITSEPPADSSVLFILMNVVPYAILFIFIIWMMRQAASSGGQAFSFGRSKAKQVSGEQSKKTFEDVAGVNEAVTELAEVVDYLKNPGKYESLGARIPKGVLLLGAPGTGKTLLGRAVAGEAGVPFYHISGSDFVEMFVGVGASRVRDLFEQAKKTSPCIVFVDEIDAVGRQRGAGLGGGHDEREQTLNQLLVEMDGFEPNEEVIVLAATNRPDVLDPALLRPGRFDRQVVVDKPDMQGRNAILVVHSKGKPLGDDIDLDVLARRTPGFTGADLENLLNEAALLAAREGMDHIEMKHCEEAIDRVLIGPERKSRIIREQEKDIIAYHEAGHALVAKSIPEADPVRKVTILPRGMALGVTWHLPLEDKFLKSRKELLAEITSLMGGRVAEEVQFQEITTGASNDIEVATKIARDMVTKYGMSEKMGPLTFGKQHGPVFLGRDMMEDRNYSDDIAGKIDQEIRNLVDSCYERARRILLEKKVLLSKVVEVLREKEVLEGDELDRICKEWETGNTPMIDPGAA